MATGQGIFAEAKKFRPENSALFSRTRKSSLENRMTFSAKKKIAASLLCLSSAAYAQIPVTITASFPDTANQIQTMTQWANQYTQMVGQINQMKQQYVSITGNRGLGQIMNNPALRGYLPDQWAGIYDKVRGGTLPGISSAANSIFSTEGFDGAAVGGRKRQLDVMAANKAMTMQAYDATLARVSNINALMAKADTTMDTKAAADLQNRMAAENAMIQNEQIRLNLLAQLQVAETQLANEQRAHEFDAKFAR
jgi:type IV secretion system protein VirB5